MEGIAEAYEELALYKRSPAELPPRLAERLVGLLPWRNPDLRVLVLGSFPSERSLETGSYYGHPANHFWPILSRAYREQAPTDAESRRAWALAKGLGLWDCIASCRREGSLDQAIRESEYNDLVALIRSHAALRRILCNGSLSYRLFGRIMNDAGWPLDEATGGERSMSKRRRILLTIPGHALVEVFPLPSTSPVPSRAFRSLDDKLPLWMEALSPNSGE